MDSNTLGKVLVEAILANPRGVPSVIDDETTWATCHGEGREHAEQVAAAVVAAHQAAANARIEALRAALAEVASAQTWPEVPGGSSVMMACYSGHARAALEADDAAQKECK